MPKRVANRPASSEPEASISGLPSYPVTIGPKTYKLCFDFDELCKSEELFNDQGHHVNLLFALDMSRFDLRAAQLVFAAAVRTFQPELDFGEAKRLVTVGCLYSVATTIINAFVDAKEAVYPISSINA